MNELRQPPINYIERITAQYQALGYGTYEWVHSDTAPAQVAMNKPLAESRLGLVATGGVYVEGQTAFSYKDDTSYRSIPNDVGVEALRATHFAYDLTDARKDINVVFPIETLRELAAKGEIGELAPSLFTCMGGIYSQRRVREELAPALVQRCKDDEIDVVLLVPV